MLAIQLLHNESILFYWCKFIWQAFRDIRNTSMGKLLLLMIIPRQRMVKTKLLVPLVSWLNSVSCSWLSLFSLDHRYLQWNLVKELTYILLISCFTHQHLDGEKKLCIFSSCSELLSNSSPSAPTFNTQSDRQLGCIFTEISEYFVFQHAFPLNLFID